MHDNAFDELQNGKKNLRVHLVVDQTSEGWKTQQESIDDRRAAAESTERQKEAHQALMRQVKTQTCQMWIAFIAVMIAAISLFLQTLKLRQEESPQHAPSSQTLPTPSLVTSTTTPDYGSRPTDACKKAIQNHYHRMFGPHLAFQFDEATQASINDPQKPGQKIHGWLFEARWEFTPPAQSNWPMAARFLARGDEVILVASIGSPFESWQAAVARAEGK